MANLAFISRHAPTAEQIAMAAELGFTLVHVGDADAFEVGSGFVHEVGNRLGVTFEGVIVVHPAAAMNLCGEFLVGVFKNANRAAPGQPPKFEAESMHVWDLRD